jgi:hypothetical protein
MMTLCVRMENTALHYATCHNHPASIEALVKMKADVNICSKKFIEDYSTKQEYVLCSDSV